MIAVHPAHEENLDGYGDPPLEWERVIASLNRTRELDAADAAGRFWVATTGPMAGPT